MSVDQQSETLSTWTQIMKFKVVLLIKKSNFLLETTKLKTIFCLLQFMLLWHIVWHFQLFCFCFFAKDDVKTNLPYFVENNAASVVIILLYSAYFPYF
jgi:hypothetical protein